MNPFPHETKFGLRIPNVHLHYISTEEHRTPDILMQSWKLWSRT